MFNPSNCNFRITISFADHSAAQLAAPAPHPAPRRFRTRDCRPRTIRRLVVRSHVSARARVHPHMLFPISDTLRVQASVFWLPVRQRTVLHQLRSRSALNAAHPPQYQGECSIVPKTPSFPLHDLTSWPAHVAPLPSRARRSRENKMQFSSRL